MKQFCRYKNHFIEDSSVMMLMDLYKNGDLAQAIVDQKGKMFTIHRRRWRPPFHQILDITIGKT